jgi:hypothetical protein
MEGETAEGRSFGTSLRTILAMNIETPPEWRKAQTIFNFLWWLNSDKGYEPEYDCKNCRMADPFYIEDAKFDELYKEYLHSLTLNN